MTTATTDPLDLAERLVRVRLLAASGEAEAIRRSARLSLGETGRAINASHVTVMRWEDGSRRPTGPAALRYADLLDRLREILVDDDDETDAHTGGSADSLEGPARSSVRGLGTGATQAEDHDGER